MMVGEQSLVQDPRAPGDLKALSRRLDVLKEQWDMERKMVSQPMVEFELARREEDNTWEELRLLKIELANVYHRLYGGPYTDEME